MPNPLAITLHEPGSEAADGTGTVVDLGDRTYVEVIFDVTAITGTATPSIAFVVETSLTQTDWKLLGTLPAQTASETRQLTLVAASRYLRVRWTITGTGPSVNFAITGTAHQLYCEPSDITRFGIPKAAVSQIPLAELGNKCLSASEEAAGYLASAYTMPMVSWGTDLRRHVACMATYDLMRFFGYDPDSGKDMLIKDGRENAIAWLNRIAAGKLRPPGMVDTTPEVTEPEVYVESAASRGWHFP